MSAQNATERLELGPWQVGDLRLTALLSPLAPIEARTERKRWEALVGTKPEKTDSRRFGREVEESGPFASNGTLTCRDTPRGTEWMLGSDNPEAGFLSPQVLVPFKDLMGRWLVDCPPLQRLAFGAALYLPVAKREEGYRQLKQYLPFSRENSLHAGGFLEYSPQNGDFLYQFNRRRPSGSVPGVQLNRLSKWQWVPLGEVRVEGGKLVEPSTSACLLELDINTAPEFQGVLPHDRLVPLLNEMIGLAVEIAAQGDVP